MEKPTVKSVLQDNFSIAAFFYVVSMVFSSSQQVFGKILYEA